MLTGSYSKVLLKEKQLHMTYSSAIKPKCCVELFSIYLIKPIKIQ